MKERTIEFYWNKVSYDLKRDGKSDIPKRESDSKTCKQQG